MLSWEMAKDRKIRRDLTGQKFGRLTVVSHVGWTPGAHSTWACVCDCGTNHTAIGNALKSGTTKSCGCLKRETIGKVVHFDAGIRHRRPEYNTLRNAIRRTTDKTCAGFARYGARGVRVCERWVLGEGGRSGFECFYLDVGPKPTAAHSLDRFPNGDGDYEPGNVRWATPKQQARNRADNMLIAIDDQVRSLAEWCEIRGLSYSRVHQRIGSGWRPEEALELIARKYGGQSGRSRQHR